MIRPGAAGASPLDLGTIVGSKPLLVCYIAPGEPLGEGALGALQDRVHAESGRVIKAKAIRVKKPRLCIGHLATGLVEATYEHLHLVAVDRRRAGQRLDDRGVDAGEPEGDADVRAADAEHALDAAVELGPVDNVRAAQLPHPVRRLRQVDRLRVELGNVLDPDRLDALVANAGLGQRGPFADANWEDIEIVLRTNIDGVLHSIRAGVPAMRQSGGGQIVIISSVAGQVTIPYSATYGATKAFVSSLARSLRLELESDGGPVVEPCHTRRHPEGDQPQAPVDPPQALGQPQNQVEQLTERLELTERGAQEAAQRVQDYAKMSEIQYGKLPELEKQAIVEALRRSQGNKSQAAAALGLSRTRFYTLLRRYHLD